MPITLLNYWRTYMSKKTQHEKGEKDAAKGKYDPPGSAFFPDPYSNEEKESYRKGWRNNKDQKK